MNESLEQYLLSIDRYELAFKGSEGNVSSQTIEGLSISVKALFDDATNMQVLQQLLAGN